MRPVFADTFYFLAILNSKDAMHSPAMEFSEARVEPLLTTEWVLTELADALATTRDRMLLRIIVQDLNDEPDDRIVPCSHELFEKGVQLYHERPDKDWSLTDCISFVVMEENEIQQALTGDHHFEQAGFMALLK